VPIGIVEVDPDRDAVVEHFVDLHLVPDHATVQATQLIEIAGAIDLHSNVLELFAASLSARRKQREIMVLHPEGEEHSAVIRPVRHRGADLHA
jgi:hypothetical protein